MNGSVEDLIEDIHQSRYAAVLAVTGGGSDAIARLLAVAGASRTVIEAIVPYSEASLTEFLASKPEQACSARTARVMAMKCFQRAVHFGVSPEDAVGLACTASLATLRTKRGRHRIHVALQTADWTESLYVDLEKGQRSRGAEELLASQLILQQLARACEVPETRVSAALKPDLATAEIPEIIRAVAEREWRELLLGAVDSICIFDDGAAHERLSSRLIFPGAFHPLHEAHREMAALASRESGVPVEFEISIQNVDKPPLDYLEIEKRVAQFTGRVLWLTRAATFVEKVKIFPGATFVVGADTLERIADPAYYNGSSRQCMAALELLAESGCQFLVFGREIDGQFRGAADLALPAALIPLCKEVPASKFRHDLSSTALRRNQAE